jgi:PncC family amidohydrolase
MTSSSQERVRLMVEEFRGWNRVSTMESCTGGAVANAITSVSGASDMFQLGLVTYCNEAKIRFGVPAEVIEQYGVYSMETAKAMAVAAAKQFEGTRYGVGITGSMSRVDPANPGGSIPGVIYVAVVGLFRDNHFTEARLELDDSMGRDAMKELVVAQVANMLLDAKYVNFT